MKTLNICIACVGLSILTACQSTDKPVITKNAEVNQQTKYFVEAKISLDKLKEDINQGRKEQLTLHRVLLSKRLKNLIMRLKSIWI